MDSFSWPKAIRWEAHVVGMESQCGLMRRSILQGKDEIFLCHASAFDVYTFSRTYKAPKPFVFALKSRELFV